MRLGEFVQPGPSEDEPHQRHLAPGPCRWRLLGECTQPGPYEVLPQNSHLAASPLCSCMRLGEFVHPGPNEDELQYRQRLDMTAWVIDSARDVA